MLNCRPPASPCRRSPRRRRATSCEHAVGFRRPVRRAAEPHDHQPLGRDDDHILPDRALGEEGIARPAVLDAVIGAKAVAEIGPEARAIADPGVRRRRRRIFHPALGQDALSAGHAVIEIEQAEARPVARASPASGSILPDVPAPSNSSVTWRMPSGANNSCRAKRSTSAALPPAALRISCDEDDGSCRHDNSRRCRAASRAAMLSA